MAKFKEKEIMRMHFEHFSQREISTALKCGHAKVNGVIRAAKTLGVGWEVIADLSDADVANILSPSQPAPAKHFADPDFERLAKELQKPGVTRKLLWLEYCNNITEGAGTAYQYSQFCNLFDAYLKVSGAKMRLIHEPGRRMFVDWAGDVMHVTDAVLGIDLKVYVFVATLPFSSYLFAEGFFDMKQPSWNEAHIHAFEFFGGAPTIIVPDNCTTAVVHSPIYTTQINDRYRELAEHYGTAVIPARVRKPNDYLQNHIIFNLT